MNTDNFNPDDRSSEQANVNTDQANIDNELMSLIPPDEGGDPPVDPPPSGEVLSLNQISPIAGAVAGGLSVTLYGSGFQPGAAVYFGNTPATQVTFESPTVIHAVTPANPTAGSATVAVINPDGNNASIQGGFTYVSTEAGQQAEVVGISPLAVLENTQSELTIRGRNLIQAYNSGVFALRGPSRCQVSFSNVTTSHDAETGLDTIKVLANIQCTPVLQPLERLAIQVLASTRPEAANDGVVQTSKQMFTVLPKSVPVPLAYTASLTPNQPNLVMVSGRNLDGYQLSLDDGTQVMLQKSDDKFVSGIVSLPENYDTSQPVQLLMKDSNGVQVDTFQMEFEQLLQAPQPDEYLSLAQPDETNLNLQAVPGQQFIGPSENDNAVFSLNSLGWGGIYNWSIFEITILDLTIILPIVNEVHLIPFFDGGDELNSPVVAEVGKIFRLRGAGLLVAYRIEVQIHIRVAVIIGFYTYTSFGWGFWNEFPELDWGIGTVVLGVRVEVQVLVLLSFLLALVKPNGQLQVLASVNLTAGIDFTIDNNGLHFDPEFTHQVNVIGINPVPTNPTPCGNKFELLPQNGLVAVPGALGFEAQYAVHEAGDCCLPWDFKAKLLRFRSTGQPEVVQEGFQTSYCLTAVQPPIIEIEPRLGYLGSNGKLVEIANIERYEPHETPRQYILAAKIVDSSLVTSNGTFQVKVKVAMKTEDSSGNPIKPLDIPALPFSTPAGAPRKDLENDLKKFFSGNLANVVIGGDQNNSFEYNATLELNVTTVNKDDLIPFVKGEIYPNQAESSGKFVPPDKKVTGNETSLKFELAPNSGYSINANKVLKRVIVNEETYEEYYRVFTEIRNVLHSGGSGLADLAGFADLFQKELAKPTGGLSILKAWGKNLWNFGVNYVKTVKRDDRPLYYARLEALAVLKAYGKRNSSPISPANLGLFEYSSRGFETNIKQVSGVDVTESEIPLLSQNDQNIIVTGFDPFSLNTIPERHNTSGIIALGLSHERIDFAKVHTAVFPVRWRDFDAGLVEQVMNKATDDKSVSLIMTCSWTPDNYFRVDRFATRYRGGGYDNERASGSVGASVPSGDSFLESTLPYDFPGLLTDSGGTKNKMLRNGSKLALDQDYLDPNWVEHLKFEIDKENSYKKSTIDLPSAGDELKSGSGGNYLSNEIFYRTAVSRKANRSCLPTGHLHVRRREAKPGEFPEMTGDFILDGARQSLELLLPAIRRINFDNTPIGTTKDENVVIYNNTSSLVQINSNNLSSLPDFELVAPTGNIDIPAAGNKTLTFRFRPTINGSRMGYAQLKNGNDVLYCIELKGKGFYPPPTITAVRSEVLIGPTPPGKKITIEGTNFINTMTVVKIGGVAATPITFIDSTKIEVILPTLPGGSMPNVEVITPGGSDTKPGGFTVASRFPKFSPTAFSPTSGPSGSTVAIYGENFTGATNVKIGGVSASFTVDSDIQITATVPSGAASSAVEVVTPEGSVTSSAQFTVLQPPVIYTFQPSIGGWYSTVTIYGENFDEAFDVRMGGVSMSFSVDSSTQISATVPSISGDYSIEVETPQGTATTENIGHFYVQNEYGGGS